MAKDVCKCPKCKYSLSDMVEEYDNQEILPKERKIFICPSCNTQLTFERLYISIAGVALLILSISILIGFSCLFLSEKCNSFKNNLNIINLIAGLLFGGLLYLNKWVPRLKIYKP